MVSWFKSKRAQTAQPPPTENPPPYEVAEFSIKHGLSIIEARRILRESESREEADAAVKAAVLGNIEKQNDA